MPVGSLIGGIIGSQGAAAAGGAAAEGGRKTLEAGKDWAKQIRAWASPWITSGQAANDEATQLLGLGHTYQTGDTYNDAGVDQSMRGQDQQNALARFKTSPDYGFRLSEGLNALDRSAASRGMLLSGKQVRGAQQFGGDLASGEYNNYFSKLTGMSNAGATADSQASGQGAALVGAGLNAFGQGQQAQASSYSNAANALASGITGAVKSGASLFGAFGGFGGGGGGGVTAGAAPAGGYGGYAGYANSLPGFSGW